MTATNAPAVSRPRPAPRQPALVTARLLGLELRHNAMLWMLPVVFALFWLTTYRKTMALPPLWNMRAVSLQSGAILDFITPVVGAAAWMGSRDARRHTSELMRITARPRWARLLPTWAATTCWALAGYLVCLAVLYGMTARQASWGGPLWWPAAVVAASLPAFAALGFVAGALLPSRFTAPLAAIAAFFVLALSTQLIVGSQSYWQVSPVVAAPWDVGSNASMATFYPYVPDLAMAQVMFPAGLTVALLAALALPRGSGGRRLRAAAAAVTAAGLAAAGTAVALTGTGQLDSQGMIAIPALHDAASDRPIRFTPVCSHTAIPVCLNPAYASYLPVADTALGPLLSEVAGLPGAPARVSQAAAVYRQGTGNAVSIGLAGPAISGRPPVFRLLLPVQLAGPALTASELAAQIRSDAGLGIASSIVGAGRHPSPAQQAVLAVLARVSGLPQPSSPPRSTPSGSRRRAALSPPAPSRPRITGLRRRPAVRGADPGGPPHLARGAPARAAGGPDHAGPAAMTAGGAGQVEAPAERAGPARPNRPAPRPQPVAARVRLVRLYVTSRRVPAAVAAIVACAIGLRIALIWPWDTYGALQLPLVFEAGAAVAITAITASRLGEPERVAGRWLPFLRLATVLALTTVAVGALAATGLGAHLAGGTLDVLRNVAGMTGLGLLCAAALGGGLAWAGPTGYLIVGVYALYTQWHHPALTTPWIWPARPPHDLGAAICAGLVFTAGVAVFTVRGARDPAGE